MVQYGIENFKIILIKEYNIVDWRTISKAISNKESRKDLLEYLRKYIENVC